jgi:signal peptidase I
MASLAGYATTQVRQTTGPSPWIAAFLTLLTPGLGHIYIGQARRGIVLFALVIGADVLLMFALMGVLARFWMFAISLVLLMGLWLYIMIDATTRAARMPGQPQYSYNKWPIYAAAFVLACLVTAIPFYYGVHASALGHLGVFRAASGGMEPTLLHGEYFLADATYYHTHNPSRGDVAVYIHPKPEQSGRHYIKRIVAVEGDRIAIRAGRAVVNGMLVAEPYVDAGPPEAPFANLAESRVQPGHVFVLGDNRPNSADSDSRNNVAHGPVPVANLIGRVTDIAFSQDVTRLGRWIGTPSRTSAKIQ